MSPAHPKGQEGPGSSSPWHWFPHGEIGQKIPRISAQARPDIPFQCKLCQRRAGNVLPAARGAQGGWHCSNGDLSNKQGKRHRPRGQQHLAVHNSMIWPLKCKHLTLTHTVSWVPARFLAALYSHRLCPVPGKQGCGEQQLQLCLQTEQPIQTAAPTGFNQAAFVSGQDLNIEQCLTQKQRQAPRQKI